MNTVAQKLGNPGSVGLIKATGLAACCRMASLSPRVLPWADWQDWRDTSSLLFSPDLGARQLGVARVKAWRSRGRVPVAVDATASLIEVSLTDVAGGRASEHELQLLYGLVIIRAINGLCDTSQTKFYAEPINVLGQRMGLPLWLIDLRHDTTHGALPSLANLRAGAQQLLDWLYQQYWHKQASDLSSSSAACKSLLRTYKRIAEKAQAETPHTLVRACKDSFLAAPPPMTAGGSNDKLLYEALESFRATLPPSSITHFLIPLLIAGPPVPPQAVEAGQAGGEAQGGASEATSSDASPAAEEGASAMAMDGEAGEAGYPEEGEAFLLSDEGLSREEGLLETVKFRHRLLFVPLLLALERTYTGFVTSLLTHLAEDSLQGSGRAWGMWTAYLLCKDWHSHFPKARGLAGFQLRGAIRFSLRDKAPDKWTTAEAGHMAAPAPRQYQAYEGRFIDALARRVKGWKAEGEDQAQADRRAALVALLESVPAQDVEQKPMLGLRELQRLAGLKRPRAEGGAEEVEDEASRQRKASLAPSPPTSDIQPVHVQDTSPTTSSALSPELLRQLGGGASPVVGEWEVVPVEEWCPCALGMMPATVSVSLGLTIA